MSSSLDWHFQVIVAMLCMIPLCFFFCACGSVIRWRGATWLLRARMAASLGEQAAHDHASIYATHWQSQQSLTTGYQSSEAMLPVTSLCSAVQSGICLEGATSNRKMFSCCGLILKTGSNLVALARTVTCSICNCALRSYFCLVKKKLFALQQSIFSCYLCPI